MPVLRRSLLAALATLPVVAAVSTAHARFKPPGKAARRAAIGPLDDLSPELQRAFALTDDVAPMPAPGRQDWLASHAEPGQTFAQFKRARPNRPDLVRNKIVLQPIGALGDGSPAQRTLVDFAKRYFGMSAIARPAVTVQSLRARSRVRGHRQYRTGDILAALRRDIPADAYCLIGVTQVDLYPGPAWNFVFGEALLYERVGVYSFARYDPKFYDEPRNAGTPVQILRRGFKLMAHEIGHMFAIDHCTHSHCVMNGTNNLEETDRSPLHPCPMCLRKLHEIVGFDVAARERELGEFYRALGLTSEADDCDRRLARIVG
ncbi:MAG TPA: archaemetzincin [Nannocystis sp.]